LRHIEESLVDILRKAYIDTYGGKLTYRHIEESLHIDIWRKLTYRHIEESLHGDILRKAYI
jgi:hypothetical protein